jgi:uncharacterized membrane protein YqhA
MEAFLIFIGIFTAILIAMGLILAMAIWCYKAADTCHHVYERVDTCNDKRMILICRECGKIKKLRK